MQAEQDAARLKRSSSVSEGHQGLGLHPATFGAGPGMRRSMSARPQGMGVGSGSGTTPQLGGRLGTGRG